jgi:hypothetical protein
MILRRGQVARAEEATAAGLDAELAGVRRQIVAAARDGGWSGASGYDL